MESPLEKKLYIREKHNALRVLPEESALIDFSTNDYLGFAKNETIFDATHQYLVSNNLKFNGATGSRLLSGNSKLFLETEDTIASFHKAESALIFNSGYDANVGIFASVPQKNDVLLYDEYCHASIRDGIKMSNAKAFKFKHNDSESLERLLKKFNTLYNSLYIVTESVFSMDGDTPNFEKYIQLADQYDAMLIVDEAHALGVFGTHGEGLIQHLNLQDKVFARIVTFGKGLGCHGAAVVGSSALKSFLINFARSFIYTTALTPHSVATIKTAYELLGHSQETIEKLKENIIHFNQEVNRLSLNQLFVYSKSAIHCAIIPGNDRVKAIAKSVQNAGFDVRPIMAPTVPMGQERLRFCIHSFNSKKEITDLLLLLADEVFATF